MLHESIIKALSSPCPAVPLSFLVSTITIRFYFRFARIRVVD